MNKSAIVTALAVSLALITACSSEPESPPQGQTHQSVVVSAAEQASQSTENAANSASDRLQNTAAEAVAARSDDAASVVTDTTKVAAEVVETTQQLTSDTAAASILADISKDADGKPVITAAVIDAATVASREAVKRFGSALKTELQAALEAGGAENALDVCNTKAPEIARQISAEQSSRLTRVSIQNRNPAGAPESWQAQVLAQFEARKAAGEDPQTLEFKEVVELNGTHQLRYMKAIPTGEACLQCHGSEVSDGVKAKLNELYPNDKATGYQLGELRGAFVVMRDL